MAADVGFMRSAVRASAGSLSGIATPEKWVEDWFSGGSPNSSGVRVDPDTAMHYSPFFAGVRVIAEDVGGLPLHVYERLDPRGKRRARQHPLYSVLHDQANPMMAAQQVRETMQGHALTWGDGIANVVTDRGVITELWPLRPDRLHVKVKQLGKGRFVRVYQYRDDVNGIYATLLPDEILHVPGFGFNGVHGYSVVDMAANSIGLGLATEHHGAKFFGNGANPGGVLQHPGELSEGARKRMHADWDNMHKGLDRAQRMAILEEGVTWEAVGIPNDNAQFLETRKMQVTEMARWLRLPPHKIGDLERATFSNIEEQQIDYVSSALRVWLVRWEQAALTQLLNPSERDRFFVEHLVDGLLRGDTAARYAAYAVGRQWGWLSADDVREVENQNPLPDGKGGTYLVPLNMVPAEGNADTPRASSAGMRGRGVAARRRIAESFKPLIADADERLAKLERSEVGALVRHHLERKRSTSAFVADVEELYGDSIRTKMAARWLPIFATFAAEVVADAAADVGHEDDVDLIRWVRAYVASHVDYRVASSIGQLTKLVEEAIDAEAAANAVSLRLDKWVEERPGKTAKWEGTQLSNAAARETWREAGITKMQWVTSGGNCPYCNGLDGKVVGIEEQFLAKGDVLEGNDGEKLEIKRGTFHPPAHPGCDCDVVSA